MTLVSVITVCFNSARWISQNLDSVARQQNASFEHLIVDGQSTDETMAIVRRHSQAGSLRWISEPDHGIYDAMNKGVALATGELVGFLNSDDQYIDPLVLSDVVTAYRATDCDFVYGDLHMVDEHGRLVRHWKSGTIPATGLSGTQIPHPALFVRRDLLNRLDPPFDPRYKISADLKQQLIIINRLRARGTYIPRPLAQMRIGGASTHGLSGYLLGWQESVRAYNEVCGSGGSWYTLKKVISKARGIRRVG